MAYFAQSAAKIVKISFMKGIKQCPDIMQITVGVTFIP
jgi:hypothetical protein